MGREGPSEIVGVADAALEGRPITARDGIVAVSSRRERAPVHDIDAEVSVLGAVLLDPGCLLRVTALLNASDFYHPAHGLIFECMVAIDAAAQPVDIVTIAAELRRRERLNTIGGAQYLGELTDTIPTTAWVETHAQLVADLARIRRVQAAAFEVYMRGFSHQSADQYSAQAADAFERASRTMGSKGMVEPLTLACQISDELTATAEGRGVEAATSGLVDVDRILSLRGNKLVVLAARPAMGKTALALKIALATAQKLARPVMFFSLEMRGVEIGRRYISMTQGIPVRAIDDARLTEDQLVAFNAGLASWAEAGVWVNPDDSMELSVDSLRAEVSRFKEKADRGGRPLAMVVIDYLQLIQIDRDAENTEKGLSNITRKLKLMAKSLNIPVVILSQLNRKCEERGDKRPLLGDLRDSGAIEQDADAVVFVYRDEKYNKNTEDKGIAEIIVAKQRAGACGVARVKFDAEWTLFRDLAMDQQDTSSFRDADGVMRDEFGDPIQDF